MEKDFGEAKRVSPPRWRYPGVLPAAEALKRLVLAGPVPSVQLPVAPGYLDQNARVVKFKAVTCVPDTCP